MVIELVYVTVTYRCGCVKARPMQPPRLHRSIDSHRACDMCYEQAERDEERRAMLLKEKADLAVRYMVGGEPMTVYRSKTGYWYGRRYEDRRAITKSFGKADPRPLLEEALN